ncbi:Uncharacterized protein GBIM_15220 [Gryllus bimaculatus]|nr:Uncharacterized protein GBIM_15220 [Gryllus bimaculatus]
MDDLRTEWIKERVLTFMGETDETIFDDMLQRSGEIKQELEGFLNRDQLFVSDESYRTIIFYKSYVDAIIEEEILVPEVVKKSKTPSRSETRSSQEEVTKKEDPDEEIDKDVKDKGKVKGKGKIKSGKKGKTKSEDSESIEATLEETNSAESPGETSSPVTEHEGLKKDDGEAEEDDETKKKKKKKKGKGEGKRKKSGRISPETLVETVPEPEPEPEPVTASEIQLGQESPTEPEPEKKVEKVIQKPILHALFGRIPKEYDEEGMRCKFVYFLRYYEDGVPEVSSLKEAWQLLPQCILVGTMESDYFIYVNRMIKNLLSPFVEMMYHEPSHIDIKEKMQIKAKVNLQDTELGNISHKTPSYYMDLIVDMNKSAEKRASLVPAVHPKQIPQHDLSGHHVDFSSNDLVHLTFGKRFQSQQAVISDSWPEKITAKRLIGSMEVDGSIEDEIQRDNAHKHFLLEKLNQIHDIIQWTIDHKEDPDSSVLPYIEVFHDPSTIDLVNSPKDPVIVEQLEKDISTLQTSVKDILQTALIQKLTGKEPLDEYTFWEERFKTLHTVVEEMKLIQSNVDKIVEVLKIAQSSHGDSFVESMSFFMKNYHEALSNHTFLSSIQRLPLEEIQFTLEECSNVLMTWKNSYFDVRKMIEEKGRSHRWEFDRNRLFRESEWIRTVCNDLLKITKVLKEFNNIFGAELKSELEDPAHVDAIMDRVYTLLDPIKNSEFDIYDWKDSHQAIKLLLKFTHFETRPVIHEELKHKLQCVLQHYKKELLDIESDFQKHKEDPPLDRNRPFFAGSLHWTKGLYSALRKPVLSFQEVPEFHENELRKNVTNDYLEVAAELKNYMDKKYTVWLDKSIPTVQKSLKKNVLKCMHIHKTKTGEKSRTWESAALQRLLKTSYSVYKMKEKDANRRTSYASTQSSIPVWKRPPTPVHVTMSQRARATKQPKSILTGVSLRVALFATRFKRKRSSRFTHSPTYSSEYEMHKHDLRRDHGFDDYEIMEWEDTPEMTKFQNFLLNWIEDRRGSRYLPWPSVMKSTILLEYNLRFDVNFNNDLLDTLEEAILMEDLGYSLPVYLHDIVVQKDNIALEHEKICKMVSSYNDLLSGLAKAELCFLKNHLVEIEEKFHRGLVRVNWASLDIDHYINVCQEDLTSLFNLKKQLHKIADELQARVRLLPTYNLFYVKNPGKGYFRISAKGFFAQLTKFRNEEFIKIVAIYRTIAPMLIKLESLVLQTCTGTSTLMVPYYSVWEAEAYDALLKLCIINIKSFIRFLHTKTAYFRVDTTLNPPNVVLCPSPKGIYNIIMQSVRDFVERWKRYQNLWLYDKHRITELFASRNPPLRAYDEMFFYYENVIQECKKLDLYIDVNCVRINSIPVIEAIVEHALQWKYQYGSCLAAQAREKMNSFMNYLMVI